MREFGIYSSYHNGWYSETHHWVPWAVDAKGFASIAEANNFIRDHGWNNSYQAESNSAYVCELVG